MGRLKGRQSRNAAGVKVKMSQFSLDCLGGQNIYIENSLWQNSDEFPRTFFQNFCSRLDVSQRWACKVFDLACQRSDTKRGWLETKANSNSATGTMTGGQVTACLSPRSRLSKNRMHLPIFLRETISRSLFLWHRFRRKQSAATSLKSSR